MRAAQRTDLMFLKSALLMGGPRYCYNLTVIASFRATLLFAWMRGPGPSNMRAVGGVSSY